MSAKGKYGLYQCRHDVTMYFPNETGWHMFGLSDDEIWSKADTGGWDNPLAHIREGAALVAPLTILYWEKDDG